MSSNFGDIMAETETVVHGDFTPMERICLTANGNLQRILSAYFNAKVTVLIIKNNPTHKAECLVFDRYVTLNCNEVICCHAKSTVTLTSANIISLINDQKIGIGQLFRFDGSLMKTLEYIARIRALEFWTLAKWGVLETISFESSGYYL